MPVNKLSTSDVEKRVERIEQGLQQAAEALVAALAELQLLRQAAPYGLQLEVDLIVEPSAPPEARA